MDGRELMISGEWCRDDPDLLRACRDAARTPVRWTSGRPASKPHDVAGADRSGSIDPYGAHLAAAKLALARHWNVSVRTASAVIEGWAHTLDVRAAEIGEFVLEEVYGYWRRHGLPSEPSEE